MLNSNIKDRNSDTPKISIFLSSLDGGGAERVMLNLAEGFQSLGFQVDLVLGKSVGPYLSQIPFGVNVVDLKQPRLLGCIFALRDYLKSERPFALLSALEDTNIVAIFARSLAKVKIKLVVTVHNYLSQESRNAHSLKRKLVPYFLRWIYPFSDDIVGVSEGVVEDLRSLGCPRHKTHVIYNPIVTHKLLNKIQEPVSHPWLAPEQPPVIIAVGRLTPQKDFQTLLKAFALVHQRHPSRLILLGEGEERRSLEALATALGIVEDILMPGFLENPYCLMARAKVLVLSSAWEGFGNVLVEAMAAGTPVVSTDCQSGPREILDNGKYGKLVPVGDIEFLADAILDSLSNPPDADFLKQRAAEFSLEIAVSKYQQLLGL